MEELKTFLRKREISEDCISQLEEEKIDSTVLACMSFEELSTFFPRIGDRIAVKEFVRKLPNGKKKNSLIEKLQKKILKKDKTRHCSTSSSDEDKPKKITTSKYLKRTRQIEIGWFHRDDGKNHVQVRAKQGGGTRKIDIQRSATKEIILEKAKELFFDYGVSPKGPLDEFDFEMWDYKHYPLSEDYTVEKLFEVTGFSRLKFYMATTKKELIRRTAPATVTSNSLSRYDEIDLFPIQPAFISPVVDLTFEDIVNDVVDLPTYRWVTPEISDGSEVIANPMISNEPVIVTVHRGRVLDELITAFASLDARCGRIQVEMILPNGKCEIGQDFGGIFRDCLSEFWETFYDTCTSGTMFKLPILRHDFTEKWLPIAKILYRGWLDEKYFPVKLCPTFMEYCLFGKGTLSNILEDYLNTLGQHERDVLKTALNSFAEVDEDDLLEILSDIKCKMVVDEKNIESVLKDIAHKEIVQESKFIMDCWRDVLQNLMTRDEFEKLYKQCQPTSKSILPMLTVSDVPLNAECATTFGFLKKYIREADTQKLGKFLRFCTGADILVGKKITVAFNSSSGFGRAPVGRTCGCILELPNTYTTFPEFRTEMNNLLKSDVWVMDII